MNPQKPLISIVTPVYNAERFLVDTIKTVQDQTYQNWEWLLVNDGSSDSSVRIIKKAQKTDKRIKLIAMPQNGGAAKARNVGTEAAMGSFLAFLDADDLWVANKLEKQIDFMVRNSCDFSFTSYEFADVNGNPTGKRAIAPATLSYREALKRSSISTITVLINLENIAKIDVMMPNYSVGEDTATWWHILRKYDKAYGMPDVLSYYRRGLGGSLSSNKLNAIKWRWKLYREREKLSFFYATKCFCHYAVYAMQRRI